MEGNDWSDAERRVERAQELYEQRRWNEALAELQAATAINPYNPAWLFNLGLILDQLGRQVEAIEVYQQVIEIDPNDIQALLRMGADLHELGRFLEAVRVYEKIQAIDATFEASYCGRILTYAELGEHQLAEEMFYLARLYKDHCPQCYFNMGISLAARKNYDRAIFCWQRTLDIDPAYPQAHLRVAHACWNKSQRELARQHFLDALRQDPGDTETLLDLARLLGETGRWDEAGEKIRRAIEIRPDAPEGHYALGCWQLHHSQTRAAESALKRAIQLDPTFPGAHLKLAVVFQQLRDLSQAKRHLRAELLLRPDNPKILMDLSNLLVDFGDTRAALACLKRLVHLDSQNADAWQNLAVVQFMRRRFDEGIESSHEALRIDPDNLMVSHNLALAMGKMGNFDEALAGVEVALRKSPRDQMLQRLQLRLQVKRAWAKVRAMIRRVRGK